MPTPRPSIWKAERGGAEVRRYGGGGTDNAGGKRNGRASQPKSTLFLSLWEYTSFANLFTFEIRTRSKMRARKGASGAVMRCLSISISVLLGSLISAFAQGGTSSPVPSAATRLNILSSCVDGARDQETVGSPGPRSVESPTAEFSTGSRRWGR